MPWIEREAILEKLLERLPNKSKRRRLRVVPAKAGTQWPGHVVSPWIPAFAGMTSTDPIRTESALATGRARTPIVGDGSGTSLPATHVDEWEAALAANPESIVRVDGGPGRQAQRSGIRPSQDLPSPRLLRRVVEDVSPDRAGDNGPDKEIQSDRLRAIALIGS